MNRVLIGILMFLTTVSVLKANTCLDFDGVNDYVQVNAVVIPASGDFTVSVWAKLDGSPAVGAKEIFSQNAGTGGEDFFLGCDIGIIRAGDNWVNTGVSYPTDGEWHYFTVVKDSSNTFLYVDGVLEATKGSIINNPAGSEFRIARQYGEFAEYWDGNIDEVRIWNVARTIQEINEDMDNALVGTENGLVGYYQFNEGSGALLNDTVTTNAGNLYNMDDSDWVDSPLFEVFVQTVFPSDNETNIPLDTDLTITFDRPVTAGVGNIVIHKTLDDSVLESIPAINTSITDSVVTIELTNSLAIQTDYYVLIDSLALSDGLNNYFDGISDKTVWNFQSLNYFTDISASLIGVRYSSVSWGDYDNDGDLDILLTGDGGSDYISRIYRNDSGIFADIGAGLIGVKESSAAWGDYDNDGDLDVLLTGDGGSYSGISRIYRNDSGIFADVGAGLAGVYRSSVAWGDYDNDGDLDILLTGSGISKIYRNDSGNFTDIGAGLAGIDDSSVAWGDFDNDGDLDILLTGYTGSYTGISKIYRNDSGTFTDIGAGLTAVYSSSVAWGDYDNDGDLDILLTGISLSGRVSRIYRNDSGIFADIGAGLTAVYNSSVAWGDYDNDGDLDLLLTGNSSTNSISTIYRNDSGTFTDIGAGLTGVYYSSVAWGDYDNDGDLDILLTGKNYSYGEFSKIYRNNSVIKNTIPSKPSGLLTIIENDVLKFSFNSSTDNETPQPGLSYNLDVVINNSGYKPGMSDISNGYRKVVEIGNTNKNTFFHIPNFYSYYPQEETKNISWKVQAIDHCFAGSEFSESADTTFVSRDLEVITLDEMEADDILSWEVVFADSILNYQLELDNDTNFGSPITELIFKNKIVKSQKGYQRIALNELTDFDSLISDTRYYWRVKPNYFNKVSRYPETSATFIYNPFYSAPSPVNIAVEGEYVTLTWNIEKDAEKGEVYNVYSSDDPHAVFPEGWTKVAVAYTNEWTVKTSEKKKFYCVTTAGSVK